MYPLILDCMDLNLYPIHVTADAHRQCSEGGKGLAIAINCFAFQTILSAYISYRCRRATKD